jgi:hypothetical protein
MVRIENGRPVTEGMSFTKCAVRGSIAFGQRTVYLGDGMICKVLDDEPLLGGPKFAWADLDESAYATLVRQNLTTIGVRIEYQ